MNESGLAGYPGSESVSVPPATVASVRRTWIRFGNSVSRFSLSVCWLLRKTRRHTYIYIYVFISHIRIYVYRHVHSEANELFSKCDCYVQTILFWMIQSKKSA